MMRAVKPLLRLARDRSGAALVEFAMIAPALLLLLLGIGEMAYNFYMQAQLQGAVQKTARDSTIENADVSLKDIDNRVEKAVLALMPNADLKFDRKSYSNFGDVAVPEDFKDINGDGTCNNGEPYEDANGNDFWDEDRGREGLGGARDAVLYTVSISYPRAFGVAKMLGASDNFEMEAATVLRNQPFSDQVIDVEVEHCF